MRALAHATRMREKDEHGVLRRARLEASAARGNADAIAALIEPEYPDSLEYLRGWADDLVGTSGVGMDGVAPLSWSTIDAWSRRTGIDPDPEESRALRMLDAVLRHPELVDPPADTETGPVPADIPVWPQ